MRNFDTLRNGAKHRLKTYKAEADASAQRREWYAAKCERREMSAVKAEPDAWKQWRFCTLRQSPTATRSDGCIHMDSGTLDHLREPPSHEISRDYGRGWYCDAQQSETIAGRVSRLTHGRFVAWIVWSDCDGITVDASIYHDARTAWFRADNMARRMAEEEREHSERWHAAQECSEKRDAARLTLRESRSKVRAMVQSLREQGAIVPSLCTILRERIVEHRAEARAAVDTIRQESEKIAELGMVEEF